MNAPAEVWVVVREDGKTIDVRRPKADAVKVAAALTKFRASGAKPVRYKAVRYVRAEGE